MDEQALIRRCQAGEIKAFEPLFRAHVSMAVRTANMVVGDWAIAEDAAQEAFMRAFGSMNSFRPGQPFAPWFYRIVLNEARRLAARAGRQPEPAQLPDELMAADEAPLCSRSPGPAAVAAATLVVALGVTSGSTPLPGANPGSTSLPTHPSGRTEGGAANQPQVPEPVRKLPYSSEKREPAYGQAVSLPVYLNRMNTVVLGQVVNVLDTEVPCVDPHSADSPPPPDHPKAKLYTPTECDPFPAKLYTVKITRVSKGDPGQSVQVRQLVPSDRVVHPDGQPDSLMNVGSTYLFFFSPPRDGVFEEPGSRLELGADNRLIPTPHTSAVLRPIFGLTPDEAAEKLLHP